MNKYIFQTAERFYAASRMRWSALHSDEKYERIGGVMAVGVTGVTLVEKMRSVRDPMSGVHATMISFILGYATFFCWPVVVPGVLAYYFGPRSKILKN